MGLKDQNLDAGGSSETQEDPPQPQQAQTGESSQAQSDGRILHVYFEGWKMDSIRVCDSDKTSVLYTAELRLKKPYMTLHSAPSNSNIGTVNFHTLTTRIDTTIHDQSIALTSHGMMKLPYNYNSPAFGGMEMTWNPRSKLDELKLVLLDDKANPVAKFEPTNWSTHKSGKFELLERSTSNAGVMDEVVSTELAVIYYRQVQRLAAAIA
jgi:hypothetical protein